MKRLSFLLLILILSSASFGQNVNVEKLMTRRYYTCQDVFYNAQFLIPEYYKKDSKDTLNAIIDFWQMHCGRTEEIVRFKILFAIDGGVFKESTFGSEILRYLVLYRNKTDLNQGKNHTYYTRYSFALPNNLDKFTVELARKLLLVRTNLTPLEKFILQVYSNNNNISFADLQSDDFKGTLIQQAYFDEVNRNRSRVISHGGIYVGIWIPQGNLNVVGVHPVLGFQGGIKYKKLTADVSIGLKFVNSPNVYQVYLNDSVWNTNHFFGGYLGLDLSYELFKVKKNSFNLTGGVAFDGFDALSVKDQNSKVTISKSLNSLNLNLGLGYKYNFDEWHYLGIDFKYNLVDYKNSGGTDLSGNVYTINLVYGFMGFYGERYKSNMLHTLDYTR